jgi:FHS family L-fucose permease-like MFS transporter
VLLRLKKRSFLEKAGRADGLQRLDMRKGVDRLGISAGSTGSEGRPGLDEELEAPLIPRGRLIPFIVVTPLFFLWAIPNNLTDFLIRQFMKSFEINRSGAAQLQIGIFVGYFLMAIPAGQLMRHFGYKAGLVTGLILMGSGCWLFWPAAHAEVYPFFVAAQFVIGCGLSFLETGANSFIAQLGPTASSERRLNLSQAFNPLGSITAGLVGTVFIFSGVEFSGAETAAKRAAGTMQAYLHSETLRVVPTYLVLGTVALLWALMVLMTKFPDIAKEDASREDAGPAKHVRLMQRHFVLAVLAQFLYVGAQVGTWSYFILYVRSATGVGDKAAGYMLTGTLAAFAVGRFSSAWLMKHFHARSMLGIYSVVNVVLGLAAVARPGWVGAMCLLTTSLFMSIMFPTIFALGLKGMGDKTKTAGSLLVMAILGGAALTKLMGMLADSSGLQAAYLVPVVCFAGVALYAWFGGEHKEQQVS